MNADWSPSPPEPKFTIFISHPVEDGIIAVAMMDALTILDRLRIDVFVDQAAIPKGQQIGSYIKGSLDRASWFIAIGPDAVRSNFSWCGLELGYFIARSSNSPRLLTLIFHDQIHSLFEDQNNTRVVPLTEEQRTELPGEVVAVKDSPLYKLFIDIAGSYMEYYHLIDPRYSVTELWGDWAEKSARSVTSSYWNSLRQRVKDVWYPQNRLEIRIKDGNFWKLDHKEIPADAETELDIPTYGLFRLAAPAAAARAPFKWSEFCQMVRQQQGAEGLLKMVTEVLCSVLPYGADAENDFTFVAPNGIRYRVLLVKHQRYGTNRRDFVINFVPTLRRDVGGDEVTTQLMAAIAMASKYWFMFLEDASSYSVAAFNRCDAPETFVAQVKKMLRDMDRVSLEAADDGLADKRVLVELLGRREDLTEMFGIWWPAMDRLRGAANEIVAGEAEREFFIAQLSKFLEVSRSLNRDFIRWCLDAYKSRLEHSS